MVSKHALKILMVMAVSLIVMVTYTTCIVLWLAPTGLISMIVVVVYTLYLFASSIVLDDY